MRKYLFLFVLLGATVSYALVAGLFPDNTRLPRIPEGVGTLGHVIAKILGVTGLGSYSGDGSAENSMKLDGYGSGDYLKIQSPCGGSYVWGSLDANSVANCIPKPGLLVGTWSEGVGSQRCPASGACVPLTLGMALYSGDVVRTPLTATGMITFSDDLSILRLDTDTIVELQTGVNTSGDTIAQAILNNGQLWGRIMTSSGINIGGGGVIAGVRGTSILLTESYDTYTMSIVDSIAPGGSRAVSLMTPSSALGVSVTNPMAPGQYVDKSKYTQYTYNSGAIVNASQLGLSILLDGGGNTIYRAFDKTKEYLYTNSPQIRENTKEDIEYLYAKKNNAVLPPILRYRADNEFTATLVPTDNASLEGLCADSPGKIFWPSLVGTKHDRCRETGLYAFADYTRAIGSGSIIGDDNIYTQNTVHKPLSGSIAICNSTFGCKFSNSNYLGYTINGFAEKNAKIFFIGTPPSGAGLISFTGGTIPTYDISISKGGGTWFSNNWPSNLVTGQGTNYVSFLFPPTTNNPITIGNYRNSLSFPFSGTGTARIQKFEVYQ